MLEKIKKLVLNNKGMALVTVLIVSVILALVGNAFLNISSSGTVQANQLIEREQTFYVAETGVEYARHLIATGDNWKTKGWSDTINTPLIAGTGGFATIIFGDYDLATKKVEVASTGNFKGYQRTVTRYLTAITSSAYQIGLCGCEQVIISGSALIDSYDGSEFEYAAVGNPITSYGDIGSNGNMSIGAAIIKGDIIAGGSLAGNRNCKVTETAQLGGNADNMSGSVDGGITENVIPEPQPCDCDAIDVAALAVDAQINNNNNNIPAEYLTANDFSITGNNTFSLPAGTYYFTSFKVDGTATVNISGEVNIIFDDVTEFTQGGEFKFTGTGLTNASNNTGSLHIYSNSAEEIKVAGTADFAGTIFAPKATVILRGNAAVFGSIYANLIDMAGSNNNGQGEQSIGGIHYDTSLAEE